jgi:hypothetical protein
VFFCSAVNLATCRDASLAALAACVIENPIFFSSLICVGSV